MRLVFALALLAAVADAAPNHQLSGEYWFASPEAHEKLTLKPDGSFHLSVTGRTEPEQELDGRWTRRSEEVVLVEPFLRDGRLVDQDKLLVSCIDHGCAFYGRFWRVNAALPRRQPPRKSAAAFLAVWAMVAAGVVAVFVRQRRTPIDRRYAIDVSLLVIGVTFLILSVCGFGWALNVLRSPANVFAAELGFAPTAAVRDLSGGVVASYDVSFVRLRFEADAATIQQITADPRWGAESGTGHMESLFREEECGWPTRVLRSDSWCDDHIQSAILCVNDSSGHVAFESVCGPR